jgi:hypothetical protein
MQTDTLPAGLQSLKFSNRFDFGNLLNRAMDIVTVTLPAGCRATAMLNSLLRDNAVSHLAGAS